MKRLLKDKRGMSLMEILVAFTLLMILIVGTTPVMLTAYDSLYTAGEYTQDTYDAKTEIEDQLATRSSVVELQNFAVNFNNLGAVAQINAKKAVSKFVNGLETVFTGGRAYITIISGNTVNDDAKSHEFTVQISNYKLNSFDEICDLQDYNDDKKYTQEMREKTRLAFNVIIPTKSKTKNTENLVYDGSINADVEVIEEKSRLDLGRITVRISGEFDFTKSPLKIQIYYYDEDGNILTTADYLHIKTPTIIAAGKTSATADYYTTAGVVTTENKTTNTTTTTFDIEGRKMSTSTYQSTQAIPANTVFKSVSWVTETVPNEDETGTTSAQATNPFETSYYVLTGTNGAIYRTYSQAKVGSIGGRVNIYASCGDVAFGINGLKLNNHTGMNQLDAGTDAIDVMGVNEATFTIDETGDVVYPAGWSGDFSHIFGYSSYGEQTGYVIKGENNNTNATWYTQHSYSGVVKMNDANGDGKDDKRTKGIGSAGYFSNLACYGYYYNGYGLDTDYYSMNSRKISYILTEMPYAMRTGGYLDDPGHYDGTSFDRIWERPDNCGSGEELGWSLSKIDDEWFYPALDDEATKSVPRSAILDVGKDQGSSDSKTMLPVYLSQGGNVNRNRADNGLAQLRLKALTTYTHGDKGTASYVIDERADGTDGETAMHVAYRNDYNDSKITVTDAVYIPATSKTQGGMFYIGTVAAYAMVNQTDNVGTDGADVAEVHARQSANSGRLTSYWIVSNDDGTSTTIYKHSTKSEYIKGSSNSKWNDIPHNDIRERLMIPSTRNAAEYSSTNTYGMNSYDFTNAVKANTDEAAQFFISQPLKASGSSYEEQVSGRIFSDVAFTMGYTSNREMVYTNIVYGNDGDNDENDPLLQALKFCETLYFLSHYDEEDRNPNLYMNSTIDSNKKTHTVTYNGKTVNTLNSPHNDYYNVWFPGEMYNLTKVATKNGLTVAVGYAVAGSAYTYFNSKNNPSTGLGGVFNDGVLAGMVLGEDDAFENLLYYKDNASFDADSLTGNKKTETEDETARVKYEQHGTSGQSGTWQNYTNLGLGAEWSNYGTHARNSVQFTAVDISIEKTNIEYETDAEGNKLVKSFDEAYYAYYADNWGRVFRSLVATKKSDGSIDRVKYIADQEYTSTRTAPSFMEEQKVGTNRIGTYFEKITSIKATSDLIIVTGHPKAGSGLYIVVGEISDGSAAPTWKAIQIAGLTNANKANDMLYLSDYLYIVGDKGTTSGGWISATAISSIKNAVETSATTVTGTLKKETADALYAIDGHS